MKNKILIVDDDPIQTALLATLIENNLNYISLISKSGIEAIYELKKDKTNEIDLIILDINMPEMNGIETLKSIKKTNPNTPVIMLTGSNQIENAVTSIKLGAYDFFNKPIEPEKIIISINNALKTKKLENKIDELKQNTEQQIIFENIIGHDSGLTDIIKIGRKAANADIPILISGETGVGKELFARALHSESSRAKKPFIAVNCGAIPENLVESTLFGHEKGSFTGAIAKSMGKFREANGGTIFLDEIGELPLNAQVKMLRVLQQKEVSPVGAGKNVSIDVRIISATNCNLENEITKGNFRKDLYFRLNVLEIKIPPVRDRVEDIPKLIEYFIDRFSKLIVKEKKHIPTETLNLLCNYEWSGNIREIENAVHRAVILSETDVLTINDFLGDTPAVNKKENKEKLSSFINILNENGHPKTIDEIEQEVINFNISFNKNNITKTAESLGMAKSTLYRKIKDKDKIL